MNKNGTNNNTSPLDTFFSRVLGAYATGFRTYFDMIYALESYSQEYKELLLNK